MLKCFPCCTSPGVDLNKIEKCVGDPTADVENAVLKAEQEVQVNS